MKPFYYSHSVRSVLLYLTLRVSFAPKSPQLPLPSKHAQYAHLFGEERECKLRSRTTFSIWNYILSGTLSYIFHVMHQCVFSDILDCSYKVL
jgi:hypothetical protein